MRSVVKARLRGTSAARRSGRAGQAPPLQELAALSGFGDGTGGEAALFFCHGFGVDEPLAVAGAAGLFLF